MLFCAFCRKSRFPQNKEIEKSFFPILFLSKIVFQNYLLHLNGLLLLFQLSQKSRFPPKKFITSTPALNTDLEIFKEVCSL